MHTTIRIDTGDTPSMRLTRSRKSLSWGLIAVRLLLAVLLVHHVCATRQLYDAQDDIDVPVDTPDDGSSIDMPPVVDMPSQSQGNTPTAAAAAAAVGAQGQQPGQSVTAAASVEDSCPTELDLWRLGHGPEQPMEVVALEVGTDDGQLETVEVPIIKCSTEAPEVHVQYSTDPTEYVAMLASIHSALKNSADPGRLRFHLTIPDWADERELCFRLLRGLERHAPSHVCPRETVRSYLPEGAPHVRQCMSEVQPPAQDGAEGNGLRDDSCFCHNPQFHIIRFNAAKYELPDAEAMGGHKNDRTALLNPINFARNYADTYLLPVGVNKVIYLDADTIVQGDLARLWEETPLGGGVVAGVARSCKIHMSQLYDFKKELVKGSMEKTQCYINAGVYIMDLQQYRELGIQQRIGDLIRMHSQERLWTQGVQQPSFVLAIVKHSVDIDSRWNTDSLGYNPRKKRLPPCTLRSGYVLHWNGVYKPWLCAEGADCYQAYWEPYRLEG